MTYIIDGKALAKRIQAGLVKGVEQFTPQLGRAPVLAVVLVGENPASKVYVQAKAKAAHQCGIQTVDVKLPESVSNVELQTKLQELSARSDVDGILLQLPLPKGLHEFTALLCISPEKDVDGLHPYNQGLLARGEVGHRPCTPSGVIELIREARRGLKLPESLSGLNAVVIGRSILVGKPVALMLLDENCTVAVCHSKTRDLQDECARADIVVAAIGRPEMIRGEWIKPGAIVIDVGINRLPDGKLVGDVHFDSAAKVAAAITPVPGGVGPMTIAMLLQNTVLAAGTRISAK